MISGRATLPTIDLSPPLRRSLRRILILAACVGTLLGIETFVLHLTQDPFADTRVYYDAAGRLNAGLPLYDATAVDSVGLYLYPPLLAILFRPLALLPFPVAAAIWQVVISAAFVLTLHRITIREPVVIALGCLALPIGWALAVGQAEPVITLLLTIGSPASVALAGSFKIFPWLVAVYWIGRRDIRSLRRLAGWIAVLVVVQLVLAPGATMAWLQLTWLHPAFDVRSISPFAVHPVLWVALVAVLGALALRFAQSRYGWAFAVILAVFAYPRLLVYQLMTLLAAFGGPSDEREEAR